MYMYIQFCTGKQLITTTPTYSVCWSSESQPKRYRNQTWSKNWSTPKTILIGNVIVGCQCSFIVVGAGCCLPRIVCVCGGGAVYEANFICVCIHISPEVITAQKLTDLWGAMATHEMCTVCVSQHNVFVFRAPLVRHIDSCQWNSWLSTQPLCIQHYHIHCVHV